VEPARAVSTVALIGPDYPGLKPAVKVEVGDQVMLGQTLVEDKQRAGVRYTSRNGRGDKPRRAQGLGVDSHCGGRA
jgi:Na+-transporting NADH:ubiquinone oxidoreductase subunit NqrA